MYPHIISIILLIGIFSTWAIKVALERIRSIESDNEVRPKFLIHFVEKIFPEEKIHPINDFLVLSFVLLIFGFGITVTLFSSLKISLIFSAIFILSVLSSTLIGKKAPIASIKLFHHIAIIYLLILFPLTLPLLYMQKKPSSNPQASEPKDSQETLKIRLLELLKEKDLEDILDPKEQNLVKSIARFGDLVCREIMTPRMDISALAEDSTLEEAVDLFIKERYSRIPIYRESIDTVVGVLLYKDVMDFCSKKSKEALNTTPIKSLITSIIYAPENKKIQDLFTEMKNKKTHVTVVVNEYGGTEGLVTIEDILEEFVGTEILDETDTDEKPLYKKSIEEGWIVDAKLKLVDAEKTLGIILPHRAEYETIGGFISQRLGLIPTPGTVLHEEEFKIKVLSADERQIYEIEIKPTKDSSTE